MRNLCNKTTIVLLFMLFLANGCCGRGHKYKSIGSEENAKFTEYTDLSKEFYNNYFKIVAEEEKSENLEMFLKNISNQENRIIMMEELIKDIKEAVPESRLIYYDGMELRYSRIKNLFEYSQKNFKSLNSEEIIEIGRERIFLIMDLECWNQGESYYFLGE